MVNTVLQGLLFGLAYVAPIGTQNLYVINSAIQKNKRKVIITTFFVIVFDISLAISCYAGIGILLDKYNFLRYIIMSLGSIIIFYIAFGLFRSNVKVETNINNQFNVKEIIVASFSVTWLNPQAIIDGSLLLGGFKSSLPNNMSIYFIAGVCGASIIWFSSVAFMVHRFIEKFYRAVKYLNGLCATILIFYGLKLLYTLILELIQGL
ncbi:MAG: LysE family transporter [Anaerocolumna sp.]